MNSSAGAQSLNEDLSIQVPTAAGVAGAQPMRGEFEGCPLNYKTLFKKAEQTDRDAPPSDRR
jgi:hypothetical protein